jgi:hypothetical protein
MTPREATRYLLWYGEKTIAGDEPTEEEFQKFVQAREVTLSLAHKIMRLKPADYEYQPGIPYEAD